MTGVQTCALPILSKARLPSRTGLSPSNRIRCPARSRYGPNEIAVPSTAQPPDSVFFLPKFTWWGPETTLANPQANAVRRRESRLRDLCTDLPHHTHIDLTVRTRTATSGAKQHVASADGDKLPDAKGGLHDMLSRNHPSLQDPRAGSGTAGLAGLPTHPGRVAERPMDRTRQPRLWRLLGRGLITDCVGLLI